MCVVLVSYTTSQFTTFAEFCELKTTVTHPLLVVLTLFQLQTYLHITESHLPEDSQRSLHPFFSWLLDKGTYSSALAVLGFIA